MKEIDFRTTHIIINIRPAKGYLNFHITDVNVSYDARRLTIPVPYPDKDRIACIHRLNIPNGYIFYSATIYRLQRNGRTKRIEYFYFFDEYVFKTTIRSRTKLNSACTGTYSTCLLYTSRCV